MLRINFFLSLFVTLIAVSTVSAEVVSASNRYICDTVLDKGEYSELKLSNPVVISNRVIQMAFVAKKNPSDIPFSFQKDFKFSRFDVIANTSSKDLVGKSSFNSRLGSYTLEQADELLATISTFKMDYERLTLSYFVQTIPSGLQVEKVDHKLEMQLKCEVEI